MLDLLIRGGTVVDGTGAAPYTADVGVTDGLIVEIGKVTTPSRRVIDVDGLAVTPGFVDIHTHYDGQALWDERLDPSFSNGVTTAIMGNCGVGFAPVRKGSEALLIDLMDGVEEIPGSVLAEGLKWDWNSFPEYLDRIAECRHSFNLGAHIAHGPLRYYVLGEKVMDQKLADDHEISTMRNMLSEAFQAGAWGLSSTRTAVHMTRSGRMTPDFDVDFRELRGLADVVGQYDAVFEFAPAGVLGEDPDALQRDMSYYREFALETGSRVHVLLSQIPSAPDFWRRQLNLIDTVSRAGGRMHAQINGRGLGVMLGLLNSNPFQTRETWIRVSRLPREKRLAEFRKPEIRAAILSEPDHWLRSHGIMHSMFQAAYEYRGAADFEPLPEQKLSRIAVREGRGIKEVGYDCMAKDGFVFVPLLNYEDGDLEVVREMLSSPHSVVAASDGGAHSLTVCDGALPTFMLTHWTRDRARGARLNVETVVELMTSRPARAIGMTDRGIVAAGLAADLNIIALEALRVSQPEVIGDLPSGADRLVQKSSGYRATIVNGIVTREFDAETGARPGRLLRKKVA